MAEPVISGISGRYPESDSLEELWSKLLDAVPLYRKDDVPYSKEWLVSMPPARGRLKNSRNFDAEFFGYPKSFVEQFDAQYRILHEVVFEALWDAGIAPEELFGSKTGVFIASFSDDCERSGLSVENMSPRYACQITQLTNFFGFKGPLVRVDTACASSLSAMRLALNSLEKGESDQVIVAGVCVHQRVEVNVWSYILEMTSKTGRSSCLSADADGYVRAEAVIAMLIQRKHDAKRVYAQILACENNTDGYKPVGITSPKAKTQQHVMEESLRRAGIDPSQINYVEAHMTGTQVGDVTESKAILEAYRSGSSQPLLLGCVKSITGHGEGAAGAVAISKVVKILQNSLIPPNAPLKNPNSKIDGLVSGRLVSVETPTEFHDGVIPVNAFGFGGANASVLLRASEKRCHSSADLSSYDPQFCRLVFLCNRSAAGIEKMIKFLTENHRSRKVDFLRLIDDLCHKGSSKMKWRSYLMIDHNNTVIPAKHVVENRKPIATYGLIIDYSCVEYRRHLLFFSEFRESMKSAELALKHLGVKVIEHLALVTTVGILDLLTSLEIVPNKIWGLDWAQDALDYVAQRISRDQLLQKVVAKSPTCQINGMGHSKTSPIGPLLKACNGMATLQVTSVLSFESPQFKDLPDTCSAIGDLDTFTVFLDMFGQMYLSGLNPKISKLYPAFHYPVFRDCPSLGHLLEWNHDVEYPLLTSSNYFTPSNHSTHEIDLINPEYMKVTDHLIAKKVIFPATGYLYLIQKHLALMFHGSWDISELAFRVWDLTIHSAIVVEDPVSLYINHNPATHEFEIRSDSNLHATGYASIIESEKFDFRQHLSSIPGESCIDLNGKELYEMLNARGYNYGPHYRNVLELTSVRGEGTVRYDDDWMAFADCLGQVDAFWEDYSTLRVPSRIVEAVHDAKVLRKSLDQRKAVKFYSIHNGTVACPGLLLKGIHMVEFPLARERPNLVLGRQIFAAFYEKLPLKDSVEKATQQYLSLCLKLWRKRDPVDAEVTLFLERHSEAKFLKSMSKNIKQLEMNPVEKLYYLSLSHSKSDPFLSFSTHLLASQIDVCRENKPNAHTPLKIQLVGSVLPISMNELMESLEKMGHSVDIHENLETSISEINCGFDLTLLVHPNVLLFGFSQSFSKIDQFLESITCLSPGVFLAFIYRTQMTQLEKEVVQKTGCHSVNMDFNHLKEKIERQGFKEIGENSIASSNLHSLIFRKTLPSVVTQNPILITIEEENFDWVERVKSLLEEAEDVVNRDRRIWLVGHGLSGVIGLGKCLRLEPYGHRVRTVLLTEKEEQEFKLSQRLMDKDLAFNVLVNKSWGSYRIEPLEKRRITRATPYAYIDVPKKGALETCWFQNEEILMDLAEETYSQDDLITICYSALNFRDPLYASGRLNPEVYGERELVGLGIEFSGFDNKGTRICGFCLSKGLATFVERPRTVFCLPIPNSWTLKDAATVPVCYATVYYGLIVKGKLRPGESVLIHAGSGGIGLAAISICLARKCKIFTTVSTEAKKRFVQSIYPELDDFCFSDSRSSKFEEHVLRETNGRGVDIVLNFLTDHLLEAGVRLLAKFGRLIEIGKKDIMENHHLDILVLPENATFQVACLAWGVKNKEELKQIVQLLEYGMRTGEVRPLPATTYQIDQVSQAFEKLLKANHVGKQVIKIREEHPCADSKDLIIESVSQVIFHPKMCYIVVGGLGGMGLELIKWMVAKGARKIVVTSRSGIKTNVQRLQLKKAKNYKNKDVLVKVLRIDVSNEKMALKLMKESAKMGEISGVFNLAAVLKDGLMDKQTAETFDQVCAPKIQISRNLDKLTRSLCPKLQFFVCFSSVASFGNLGQANYGFANSYMERLCERRRNDGLPGLAIQWGPIADVGLAHRLFGDSKSLAGFEAQSIRSCLNTLDTLLQLPNAVGFSAIPCRESKYDSDEALMKISRILGTREINIMNPKLSLRELGMDSVQAIEVHNYLENNFDLSIGLTKVYDMTLEQIVKIVSMSGPETLTLVDEKEKFFRPLKIEGSNPIFFFPPAVFDFLSMVPLAKGMGRQVWGFEFTEELHDMNDWDKVTDFLCSKLLKYFPDEKRYDFLSYSIGAPYAFEVARKVQNLKGQDKVSRIVFVDSTPVAIKTGIDVTARIHASFGKLKLNIDEFQHFVRRLDKQYSKDWRGNVLSVHRKLYKGGELEDPFRKFTYIAAMKLDPKLRADALLFKAQETVTTLEGKMVDNLDQIIEGNIKVIPSPGSHMDIMQTSLNLIIEQVDRFFALC